MKNKAFLLLLFIVGVMNFLPVIGLFSANQMSQAYGVELASNELQILMRHRALLFGILGGFVFVSLWKPKFQSAAMLMTGVSMVGFLILFGINGNINEAVTNIALLDVVGTVCLLIAALIKYKLQK